MRRSSAPIAAALLLAAELCSADPAGGSPLALRSLDADAGRSAPTERSQRFAPAESQAMIMLDYQIIPVPGNPSLDLAGVHLLNRFNDWLHLGLGVHAPLFKGEYGGFMAVDLTAHVQRRLFGNVVASAGLSLGGGGGGRSVEHSKVLSGSGGFVKGYAGLGYEFETFTAGAHLARMTFKDSLIDHTQLNLFVQLPFSYAIGSYARAGDRLTPTESGRRPSGESVLTLGVDNLLQIDPEGTNKGTIRNIDLQFSHYLTRDSYWFLHAGVGFQGRPLYNEVLGGLGHRMRLSPQVHLLAQLGVGSGGYEPETIDTGPGLLVHPKITAEYRFDRQLGISLSAGYLFAPRGSSRNATLGAALHYHLGAAGDPPGSDASDAVYRGYRLSLLAQSEFDVTYQGIARSRVELLTLQMDMLLGSHVYLPVQIGAAYNAYLGYPGYGEMLAGLGVQSRFDPARRAQLFGQLLVGANVHGPIVKPGVGFSYGLSDRLAIHGLAGTTRSVGSDDKKFSADYVALGLSYRFSVPSW